jgi:hypothetical protein
MLKVYNSITHRVKEFANKIMVKAMCAKGKAVAALTDDTGDIQIELAVKIIIGVVIGALVLGGVYLLWSNVIMPRVNTEVNSLFNHSATP